MRGCSVDWHWHWHYLLPSSAAFVLFLGALQGGNKRVTHVFPCDFCYWNTQTQYFILHFYIFNHSVKDILMHYVIMQSCYEIERRLKGPCCVRMNNMVKKKKIIIIMQLLWHKILVGIIFGSYVSFNWKKLCWCALLCTNQHSVWRIWCEPETWPTNLDIFTTVGLTRFTTIPYKGN